VPVYPLDDIRLVAPLGAGGAGEVWRGERGAQRTSVAVKLISGEDAASPAVARLFMHELRATAALDHPAIVDILDHGPASPQLVAPTGGRIVPGAPALVMELLPGGSLADVAALPFVQVVSLVEEVLAALAHAHARGVLHRDIKPDNVLLDARGRPRLVDFGLAFLREADNPIEDQALGTPSYVAPEQIGRSGIAPSPATDLYSLACTAWALLCGVPPFGAGREVVAVLHDHRYVDPPEFTPQVPTPPWFEAWLRRCLQKDPRMRFWDAPAALMALGPTPRAPRLAAPRPRAPDEGGDPSPRLLGLRSPVLGRDAEKHRLWEFLLDVRQDRAARVVRLEGPVGMGKSQLLDWLGAAAAETGLAEVFALHSDARGGELLDALAERLRPGGLERPALAFSMGVAEQDPWLGALWALLGGHTAGGRANTTSLLAWAFARVGRERPTILLLDEPGSPSVVQLLEMLHAHPSVGPILAVVATRAGRLPSVRGELVPLRPIPPQDLRPLLDRLVRLDGPLATRIASRCGGSPLLALSLLASWTERGVLERGPDGWRLAGGADAALPADLAEIPRRRFEEVVEAVTPSPEPALQALELAAVLGVEVDGGAWRAALEFVHLAAPEPAVEALLDRGLLAADRKAGEWRFAHGLQREAMLARAREAGRATRWHSVAAAMLAAREGEGAAERCGQHLLAAGRPDEAATPLLLAAERGQDGDIEHALALLQAAEDALSAGRVPEADQRWGRLWLARSSLELDRRGPDAAEHWASKALDTSRRHPWRRITARALYQLGRAALNRGDGRATERLLGEAAELAAELEDPWLLGRCYRELGARHSETGRWDIAQELLVAAAEELEDDPDAASQGHAWTLLAVNALRRGDPTAARAYADKAWPRFERAGSVRGLATARNVQGEIARAAGDLDGARYAYDEAAAMHQRAGSSMQWFALSNLGTLEALDGNPKVAREVLLRCIEGFEAAGRSAFVVHPRFALLAALAALEQWDELRGAVEAAADAAEAARTRGDPDLARSARIAATRAEDAGQHDIAARCRELLARVAMTSR